MNLSKLTLLLVLAILCMGSIGIVSAGSVTVDTTGYEAKINEMVTIPVIMEDANRIQSFTMKVPNTVPGVTIVLNATTPLDSYGIWSKSEVYSDTGKFIWGTSDPAHGLSGTAVTLFYIDVTPSGDAESPIEVTISVDDIYDLDDNEVMANYPVIPGSLEIPKVPTVNTPAYSDVTTTSATITFTTSGTVTEAKVHIISPTDEYVTATLTGTAGEYTATLTGLAPSTTYTVKGWAKNSVGVAESTAVTFTTETPLTPTTIEISNAPSSPIGIGKTGTLSAVVKDQNGDPMPTEQFTWSTSNPAVITITNAQTGAYQALAAGTAKLTATSKTVPSVKADTASITVVDGPSVSITAPASGSSVLEGTEVTFTASASEFTGTVTYSWTFGDGETATGASVPHTYTTTGSKTIKVEAAGKDKTGADATAEDTITLTVTGKPAAAEITVPATLYLGETGTAKAVIKDSDGNIITDYAGMTFAWTSSDDSIVKVSSANAASVTLTAAQTKGKATVSVLVTGTGFADISADSSAITVDERPVQIIDNGGADDGLTLLAQAGIKPTATATAKPTTATSSQPTVSVTVSPTNVAVSTAATTAPTTAATTEAQQPTATQGPVPVLGILAGLGAAVILGRKFV